MLFFAGPMGAMGAIGAMRMWGNGGKSEECEVRRSGWTPENGGARIWGPECKTGGTAGNGDWFL